MNLPSRALRESATTLRYVGCFLRPVRRRRILTISNSSLGFWYCAGLLAIRTFSGRTRDQTVERWNGGTVLPHEHVWLELSAAARKVRRLLHHLLHLTELL